MDALDALTRRKRRAYLANPYVGIQAVLDASMFHYIPQPALPLPGDFTLPPLPEVQAAVAKIESATQTEAAEGAKKTTAEAGSSTPEFLAEAEKQLFDKTPSKSPRSELPERESPRSAKKSPVIPVELKYRQPGYSKPATRTQPRVDYQAMVKGTLSKK